MTEDNSLYQLIRQRFNEEELRDLCLDLGVDYEDLPALGKAGKARELVILFERNGRIPQLIAACRQARAGLAWPDASRPYAIDELLGAPLAPLLPNEPETVPVPAGPFLMGSNDHEPAEAPQHEVELPTYSIGRYPVTNRQYAEFISRERRPEPNKLDWFLGKPVKGREDFPVVGVSWQDALDYCRWLSDYTGKPYRLPSEAEWEKAARGTDGRLYPWGNEWLDGMCNAGGSGLTPVTAFDHSLSPYGCADMLGNAEEWTSSRWGEDRRQPAYAYPYRPLDGREILEPDPLRPRMRRVHRGGSFNSDPTGPALGVPKGLRCSARGHARPDGTTAARGFRVVLAR